MFVWPKLQLTEYEKQFVSLYSETNDPSGRGIKPNGKPGVKRRAYRLQLASHAQPDRNIPAVKLTDQLAISRRARIFAITFSGNTDCWRLGVRNTNGTQYVNPAKRSQAYPVVSALVAGSYYNAWSQGGVIQPLSPASESDRSNAIGPALGVQPIYPHSESMPWNIEPNWVCQPNETLIFVGEPRNPRLATAWDANGATAETEIPVVLNITVYAWEFPGMGAA